jgi:hypothetical protein
MAPKTDKTEKTYVALVGLNYPTAKGAVRVEAGDVCVDLPAKSVSALLSQGAIVAKNEKQKAEPVGDESAEEATA